MAASLSRPDPSSPASVAEAGFSTSRRGYHPDEVRAFLTSVAAELGRLQERERQLEAELRSVETEIAPAPELDEEMVTSLVGEETMRVLQTARESASQIKIRAEEAAAKILNDANDEINRLRQDAEVESARKRHDATSDAEAEVALAKQQGREMVNEARAYRERVLADLERRTKVARHHIEELVHGRDRLLQVFERARLVAVDVTSELKSIDGPEELVNFSPTTGPVPLMVPASDLGSLATVDVDAQDAPDDTVAPDEAEAGAAADDAGDAGDVGVADETDDVADGSDSETLNADAATDDETEQGEPTAERSDQGESAPTSDRDANVVSLFRGRDDTDDGTTSEEAGETGDRPDVNGIFERLRAESPGDDAEPDADAQDPAVDEQESATEESDASDESEPSEAPVVESPPPFLRRDEVLTPLIVGGARKLKRVLADEQNGVLDRLRQKEPVTAADDLLAAIDEHAATYLEALSDDLIEAAVAGAAEVGKRDTKTLRTTLRKGGALDGARSIVRDDLVVPLRDRLERAVVDGGGDNEAITKRVRAVYREWKTQHIDDQLDDAFRFAHGGGTSTGVKPGTELVWTIDPAEPTCADCEDNSLAGPVAAGEPFPTGHVAAPAHPGCRCLTVPVGQ